MPTSVPALPAGAPPSVIAAPVPPAISTIVLPDPQEAVDRFCKSLGTSRRLLGLHPRTAGHPGNAAALAPAIVLSVTAAFEGFAEDFAAISLARAGLSFGEIAKKIGNWHNPNLKEYRDYMRGSFPAATAALGSGTPIEMFHFKSKTSPAGLATIGWDDALTASRSWMQVRHHLTHGLTTGWRSERWYAPLRPGEPNAHEVLRSMGSSKFSLTIHGAISCARIYSLGAQFIADAVAGAMSRTLDWRQLPTFA